MFPLLSANEIEQIRRFGTPRRHADGETLCRSGTESPGLFVVLSGAIRITASNAYGHSFPIVDVGPGGFSGELGLLSARRSYVDIVAVGDLCALLVNPEQLRALLLAEAALGEKLMRALVLRRAGLIELSVGGPVLIGIASSPDAARLRSFLRGNGVPHLLLDPSTDADARAFIGRHAAKPDDLPLVICPDGSILRNPTNCELAACIGMLDAADMQRVYDVAIAGAGPAGLAAAVHAASEGLSVIATDAHAVGGQAGTSARIENYLGFPEGVSGQTLTGRAYSQAQKFGAQMLIPAEVERVERTREDRQPFVIHIADGRTVRSRTLVVASGARYRRPQLADLKAMEGYGVWYWASPVEANLCAGQEVAVVGGGNSAGQAAVFLSGHAAKVWILIRGFSLAESMSQYLVDRIASIPNIELLTRTEVVGLSGCRSSGVESVTWRQRDTGAEETRSIRHVFLFLGADPCTEWLKGGDIALDDNGFVETGKASLPLETSVPGIFAIGDVRAGSAKRVGAAIGEGAAVVVQIQAFLARNACCERTGLAA
jgi:thioredoxin reductase (NADPH)